MFNGYTASLKRHFYAGIQLVAPNLDVPFILMVAILNTARNVVVSVNAQNTFRSARLGLGTETKRVSEKKGLGK